MPIVGKIIPRECSILDLFREFRFIIPKYQRQYSWKDEALTFFEDIWNEGQNGEYFIGPMIFITKDDSKDCEIIDGQQRIITTALILSIVRDELLDREDKENKEIARIIHSKYIVKSKGTVKRREESTIDYSALDRGILQELINKYKPLHGKLKSIKKLVKSAKIYPHWKDIFNTYMDLVDSIKKTIFSSDNYIEAISKLIDEILDRRVKTIIITVTSDSDAFLIFETLNDRGLRLGPLDLIKNYLMRIASQDGASENELIEIGSRWENLLREEKANLLETLIRYYFIAKYNELIRKREVYDRVKRHIKKKMHVTDFIDKVEKVLRIFNDITKIEFWDNDERLHEIMCNLRELGVKQHFPIIFAYKLMNPEVKIKPYMESFYKLALRYKIARINWNRVEKTIPKLAKYVKERNLKAYLDELKEIQVSDETLKGALESLESKRAGDKLVRILLIEINNYLLQKHGMKHTLTKRKLTVEHILPVSKRNKLKDGSLVSYLGNLTLLDFKLNNKIQNADVEEKIKILLQEDLPINRNLKKFLDGNEWTDNSIEKRTRYLAELIIKLTCF